jgi:hypothetical protein
LISYGHFPNNLIRAAEGPGQNMPSGVDLPYTRDLQLPSSIIASN